jgi:competence protein ComEA
VAAEDSVMRTLRLFVVAVAVAMAFGVAGLAGQADAAPRPALAGVVNINTGSAEQLQLLPGIGPAKARLVMEYRTAHPFRTVEELARVKGIGPKTVRRLRPHLTVRGATTAGGAPAPAAGDTKASPASAAGDTKVSPAPAAGDAKAALAPAAGDAKAAAAPALPRAQASTSSPTSSPRRQPGPECPPHCRRP